MKQGGVLLNTIFAMLAFIWSIAVLIERLQPHTVDYSYHLDWLVIGEVYYPVGFEISNVTTWLLLLVTGVNFLIHMILLQGKKDSVASSIYAYISLLLFALSGLLLSDNILTFYISSIFVSSSIYLLLAHPSFGVDLKAIRRYSLSQLLAHSGLLVIIIVLYEYMPNQSLQFTMLQTVFGGQYEQFTPAMINWLSFFVLGSFICYIGAIPFLNGLKLIRYQQTMVQLLIMLLSFTIVPVYVLLRFSDLVLLSALVLSISKWYGLGLVLWSTLRFLLNQKHASPYYSLMNTGLLLFAYGHAAYGYMLMHLSLWVLATLIINVTLLQRKSLPEYGALIIAVLTLAVVPPLSGYWLQQWLVTTLYMEHSNWFVPSLWLVAAISLSSTVYFMRDLKFEQQTANRTLHVFWIVAIPAVILLFFGLFWILFNSGMHGWLFGESYTVAFQLVPILWTIISVGVGVGLGWLYSKRLTIQFKQHLLSLDNVMNTISDRMCHFITKLGKYIVLAVEKIEHIVIQLLTVWLLYPVRRISHIAAYASIWRSVVWLLAVSLIITALYTITGRG